MDDFSNYPANGEKKAEGAASNLKKWHTISLLGVPIDQIRSNQELNILEMINYNLLNPKNFCPPKETFFPRSKPSAGDQSSEYE